MKLFVQIQDLPVYGANFTFHSLFEQSIEQGTTMIAEPIDHNVWIGICNC